MVIICVIMHIMGIMLIIIVLPCSIGSSSSSTTGCISIVQSTVDSVT